MIFGENLSVFRTVTLHEDQDIVRRRGGFSQHHINPDSQSFGSRTVGSIRKIKLMKKTINSSIFRESVDFQTYFYFLIKINFLKKRILFMQNHRTYSPAVQFAETHFIFSH